MKCREFERSLSDWVSGRLSSDMSARMESHRGTCARCERAAAEERGLRERWMGLRPLPQAPDLRARVLARLDAPVSRPVYTFARRWAFGAAMASTGALAALLWFNSHQMTMRPDSSDEQRMVQIVSAMQRVPDPDTDSVNEEARLHHRFQRLILTGEDSQ